MNPEYKNKILSFYRQNRRMPGYTEIMTLVGFKSKNAVYKLIAKLVDEGVVEKDSKGKLLPTRLADEIPLLGLVEAGFPTTVDEDTSRTLNLEQYLIRNREVTYLL